MKGLLKISLIIVFQVFVLFDISSGIITSYESTPSELHNVCIIGGGVSGLVTARYLQKYGVEHVKIFEASTDIGGTWKFDPRVGADEFGVPIFSSMYEDLRTNTARQNMELAGFPFPDGTPTYPTGQCFLKYLQLFAKTYQLYDLVQFQSYVLSIKRENNFWSVTYLKTDKNTYHTDYCNHVVIGTGRETKPKSPKIYGMDDFQGRIIHSHEYKSPVPFTSHKVLVIGAGPSGLDISVQLDNYTTKLIHSHHSPASTLQNIMLSSNYIKKPDVVNIVQNGACFEDGSFEELDDIIFCTGYELDHHYLDDSCGLLISGKQVSPLYNQIVNIRYPTMYFIGLVKMAGVVMFDNQADYVARHIAGVFSFPSTENMIDNWLNYVRRADLAKKKFSIELFGKFQNEYVFNMTLESGMVLQPPVISAIRDFNLQIRIEDVPHYREYEIQIIDDYNFIRYPSPYTGNECPLEHYV